MLCLALAPLYLRAQTFSENQIKGAYLFKITKFIRWDSQDSKVKLCFIGDKEDQAGETVSKTVISLAGGDNGKFNIAKNVNIKDIKSCNMLFIGTKSEPNLQDILAVLDNKPIVTISDIDSFTRRGGMFGFSNKDGNITVELNFSKAKDNHININSDLQEMINVVE